ncbi:hypothetical protein B0H19DRAFT_1080084 [Mycena capillaripes]|nr:hypothetical protein B0H19DRAFT_1080084 [Mycena capillaripes]
MSSVNNWDVTNISYYHRVNNVPFRSDREAPRNLRDTRKFRLLKTEHVLKTVRRGRNNGDGKDTLESDLLEADELTQAREAAQSTCTFSIDPDINISAPALFDPAASPSLASTGPTAVAQPQTGPVTQKRSEELN